jgi:hypothetical protein
LLTEFCGTTLAKLKLSCCDARSPKSPLGDMCNTRRKNILKVAGSARVLPRAEVGQKRSVDMVTNIVDNSLVAFTRIGP